MSTITQSITVRAPIERAFDVIADFGSYPEFLPEIEEARVLKKGATRARVAFTANLIQLVHYTLDFTLSRPTRITWTLAEADPIMKGNSGSWELEALKPSLTDVTFAADIELGIWMPKMILNRLATANLSAMLEGFKKRAEDTIRVRPSFVKM